MNYEFIKIYSNFLKKKLKPQKKLKVVFDCSNGTTGLILKQLTTNFINEKPDGNFPAHGPNPLIKGALNQLQKEVLKQKADMGIIFDSDGDRVFFIDNLGRFIDPDIIANLLIWHLNPKKIVIDIRVGWLIKKNKDSKSKIYESQIGHYFIKKTMRKNGADFGAEQSGHYYFKNFFYCDSGIIAAIEAINAISRLPYSLADFADLLPQYYRSGEINIKSQKSLFKKIEKYFKSKTTNYKLRTTNYIDGLTMEFPDWWFNLRTSNTEPLLRLNIESNNKTLLRQKIKEFKILLK